MRLLTLLWSRILGLNVGRLVRAIEWRWLDEGVLRMRRGPAAVAGSA